MHSVTNNQNAVGECPINDIENSDQFDNGFEMAIDGEDQGDLPFNNLVNDSIVPRKIMFAMATIKFATMWRLIDSDKKLQSTFISALDQFIDRTRQNQSIDIQS